MSEALAEVANFSIATRFGSREILRHDSRWRRPRSRDEAIAQIEATFRHNRWKLSEQSANAVMLGLETKSLDDYTDTELKLILDDMEKYRMILYRD